MTVLTIETCTNTASVALVDEEGVAAERIVRLGRQHCREVPGMIFGVLEDAGCTLEEVDAFAAGIGPGSFTGLRVGVAMVKGLAFANGKPTVGVLSLEGLAANVSHQQRCVWALLDSGRARGDVYWACFRCEEEIPELLEGPGCLPAEEVARKLEPPALVVGDSTRRKGTTWSDLLAPGVELGGRDLAWPRASTMGRLALRRLAGGGAVGAADLLPVYIASPNVGRKRQTT
jgi:tRNA threonylcarbamoyladenosine biosynthesis protein TsaB